MADLKQLLHRKQITIAEFIKYSRLVSQRIGSQPVTEAEDGPALVRVPASAQGAASKGQPTHRSYAHTCHIIELISIPLPSDLHSPLPIRGGLAGVNIQILKWK